MAWRFLPYELYTIQRYLQMSALEEQGYRYLPDQNGAFEDGYFPIAISNRDERRVSAAMAYLDAATRARPNLHIRAGVTVSATSIDTPMANR